MQNVDFLIIGGGVIGLSIARELKKKYFDAKVAIIEKEANVGLHASGRNSGVLHAGFYYSPDSMKAKFTKQGNKQLTEYCLSKGLKINRCGKLVVPKNAGDLPLLDELFERGKANGIPIEEISEYEAKQIEPRVKLFERALFSPTTSTVDPEEVMHALKDDALQEGVTLHSNIKFLRKNSNKVMTSDGAIEAAYVVNAAGLYADKIAAEFGFSNKYRILPFKGLYLYSNEKKGAIRTNIYPVPDLRNPFLGVHFTLTVDGKVKIGPTAIPAFWREHYKGFENFNAAELFEILTRELGLMFSSHFDFKSLALEEIRKYARKRMVSLASLLAERVVVENYRKWGKPGIRAQLVNIEEKKLVMDFLLEGDDKSMHVLNAVSPAFTCSMSFAGYVCERIESLLN